MLLITHDLGVVAQTCDCVAVMYAGEIVEYGDLEAVFTRTAHPYTKGLFDSLPDIDNDARRLKPIPGLMPNPTATFAGCKFCDRCPCVQQICKTAKPPYREVEPGHMLRCHFNCAAQEKEVQV